jgi:hypothetical protein
MFDRRLPYFYDIRRVTFTLFDVDKDLISCTGGCAAKRNTFSQGCAIFHFAAQDPFFIYTHIYSPILLFCFHYQSLY